MCVSLALFPFTDLFTSHLHKKIHDTFTIRACTCSQGLLSGSNVSSHSSSSFFPPQPKQTKRKPLFQTFRCLTMDYSQGNRMFARPRGLMEPCFDCERLIPYDPQVLPAARLCSQCHYVRGQQQQQQKRQRQQQQQQQYLQAHIHQQQQWHNHIGGPNQTQYQPQDFQQSQYGNRHQNDYQYSLPSNPYHLHLKITLLLIVNHYHLALPLQRYSPLTNLPALRLSSLLLDRPENHLLIVEIVQFLHPIRESHLLVPQ